MDALGDGEGANCQGNFSNLRRAAERHDKGQPLTAEVTQLATGAEATFYLLRRQASSQRSRQKRVST